MHILASHSIQWRSKTHSIEKKKKRKFCDSIKETGSFRFNANKIACNFPFSLGKTFSFKLKSHIFKWTNLHFARLSLLFCRNTASERVFKQKNWWNFIVKVFFFLGRKGVVPIKKTCKFRKSRKNGKKFHKNGQISVKNGRFSPKNEKSLTYQNVALNKVWATGSYLLKNLPVLVVCMLTTHTHTHSQITSRFFLGTGPRSKQKLHVSHIIRIIFRISKWISISLALFCHSFAVSATENTRSNSTHFTFPIFSRLYVFVSICVTITPFVCLSLNVANAAAAKCEQSDIVSMQKLLRICLNWLQMWYNEIRFFTAFHLFPEWMWEMLE